MSKKILFIIDGLEFGGGERVFLQLILCLYEKYKIYVATNPDGLFFKKLKTINVETYPFYIKKRLSFKQIFFLRQIMKDNSIDIVHSQGARCDFITRVSSFLLKRPKIVSTVAMPVLGFDVSAFRKTAYFGADFITSPLVDRFLVVSKVLENHLTRHYPISPSKVRVIYNGIELDHYEPDEAMMFEWRSKNGFQRNDILIGAIGRLVWQKGFEYLIRALPEIKRDFPGAKILIVGDGPLLNALKILGQSLGAGKDIIFTGFRNDIKGILSAVDLLVIPSLIEGFPMITLEAMAMAKPIVATEISGITEQITDGNNGILVPPKDPYALAQAIIRFLKNREAARNMGLTARKRVEQEFSVKSFIEETAKIYSSLMKDT